MSKLTIIFFIFLFVYSCVPIVGVSTVGIVKTSVEISDDPRSLGRIVDDAVIEKKFLFKISQIDEKYLIKINSKSIDGRFFLKGNVDTIKEKIQMTKIAWETDGVRSVENIIKVDDQSSWKDRAKDLLITSQFKVAIVSNKDIKSNNFSFTTINKTLYIFGIARNENERKIVITEAKSVQGVTDIVSSIFLKEDLSNNQRISN
ncbi:MAG: phospholipid-binding protein [Candidatus Pelagibacter sp.]|nr:phospholipid-binding protein [Candidatus Pelagibacter sp.]OUV86911.1 MAG: phospholipid-binding protein [Pelagibacteraceae bacterium TMED136]|tara:strand:+ start:3372 stop:3980 length:609 start_codon:yes stop_codon:yes gene_type:complete